MKKDIRRLVFLKARDLSKSETMEPLSSDMPCADFTQQPGESQQDLFCVFAYVSLVERRETIRV